MVQPRRLQQVSILSHLREPLIRRCRVDLCHKLYNVVKISELRWELLLFINLLPVNLRGLYLEDVKWNLRTPRKAGGHLAFGRPGTAILTLCNPVKLET